MGAREPIDAHWQQVHRALLNKIAYREKELLELHEDYIALEIRCNVLYAYCRRQWDLQDIEIANRRAAAAAND